MTAAKLTEIANAKGYRIGKERRGVYYYGKGDNLWSFVGSFRDFAELIKRIPAGQ